MEIQDIERALHRTTLERQRLEELEKAYRLIIDLMAEAGKPLLAKLSDTDLVRESIERMDPTFNASQVYLDIVRGYRGEISKRHVSAIMSELARNREIRIVSRGAGKRASIYARVI